MHVTYSGREFPISDEIAEHAERRLHFALSRFGDQVRRVTVHFWNRQGEQAGSECGCRVEVAVQNVGIIAADDMDADAYQALDRATERVGRAVSRAMALLRDREQSKRSA